MPVATDDPSKSIMSEYEAYTMTCSACGVSPSRQRFMLRGP